LNERTPIVIEKKDKEILFKYKKDHASFPLDINQKEYLNDLFQTIFV